MKKNIWKTFAIWPNYAFLFVISVVFGLIFFYGFSLDLYSKIFIYCVDFFFGALFVDVFRHTINRVNNSACIDTLLYQYDCTVVAENISPVMTGVVFDGVVVDKNEFLSVRPKDGDTRYTVKSTKVNEKITLVYYDFGDQTHHTNFCVVADQESNSDNNKIQIFEKG